MNYIITTPEEGLIIGMISGAILFGILYDVFVQNKKYEEEDITNESDENSDIKTEASDTDLYTDTLVNIRDHIVFANINLNDSSESSSDDSSSTSDEEIINHDTISFTENEKINIRNKLNLSED